jgi:hypothetical protein
MKNFQVKSVFSKVKSNLKYGLELCTICKSENCDFLCEGQGIFESEKTGGGGELKIEW